jgi:uncharacterized RDD family membrane protein YckC
VTIQQKLSIDTPEQINVEYELAGPGSRFLALFVDLMIQIIAMMVVVIAMAIAGTVSPFKHGGAWTVALMILLIFGIQWGYFALFEIFWKGQTPGKRQAGIRVINETGRAVSVYEAVTRNLLRAVDSLPGPYAVGAVVMFLSPQSKRIGDYVAGTVVIHDKQQDDESMFLNTGKEELAGDVNYAALSTDDLRVMEAFLQRRLDLPFDVRQRAALKLAEHFRLKCGVGEGTIPDNENLLEMLVRGFRQGIRFRSR